MEVLVRPGHYPGTLPTLGYLPIPGGYPTIPRVPYPDLPLYILVL